ncbi:hypothetical protein OROMI_019965 [Orobanche minor]
MIAALSFLLDGGGDDSNSEDDQATPQPQIVLNKEAMHKASRQGTTSSKKKKTKLQQQRLSSERSDTGYSSPLNHLKDAQPHKQDVTALLAAAVEACHETVPPDAVKPLFKQIVNQFVLDGSRPEDITVGLNVVRKMCLRMPLSHEKAVSASARLLLTLFREICPSLLVKKDRGQPAELRAKPKAFGDVHVPSNKSKEKKRKLSDLDAANLSLAALKNLLNEALMPHALVSRGIVAIGHLDDFRWNPPVDRPRFLCSRIVSQRLKKEQYLAFKRAHRGTTRKLSCCELSRIAHENDESKAKIATTHQEKKRKHSCKQFRERKA